MPRNSGGTFTLVAGNPVSSGTTIESAWANDTLGDLGNEMTDSLSRSGDGGMLSPLKATDGAVGAPSYTFLNGLTSGMWFDDPSDEIRFSVNASQKMAITVAGVKVTGALSSLGTVEDVSGNVRSGRKNLFINGGFDRWTRELTFSIQSGGSTYTADRWYAQRGANSVLTVNRVSNSTHYGGRTSSAYRMQMIGTSNNAESDIFRLGYRMEFRDYIHTRGKEITLSFQSLAATGLTELTFIVFNSHTAATEFSAVVDVSNFASRTSVTFTLPTDAGVALNPASYLQFFFRNDTPSAAFEWQVADIQVEIGASATDFDLVDIAETTAKCHRYYFKTYEEDTFEGAVTAAGAIRFMTAAANTNPYLGAANYPAELRTAPTVNIYSDAGVPDIVTNIDGADYTVTGQGAHTKALTSLNFSLPTTAGERLRFQYAVDAEIY